MEDFSPFCYTALLWFIEFCNHSFIQSFLKVPPQHFRLVRVWALFHCNTLILFYSVVDLVVVAQNNFSRRTDGLTSDYRILWYTEKFMVNSLQCACKMNHNQHQSTSVLLWGVFFIWCAGFVFLSNGALWIISKHLSCGLFCLKDIVPDVL